MSRADSHSFRDPFMGPTHAEVEAEDVRSPAASTAAAWHLMKARRGFTVDCERPEKTKKKMRLPVVDPRVGLR